MGDNGRLIQAAALAGALLSVLAGCLAGCGEDRERVQQRRELLTPPNKAETLAAKKEEAKVVDDQGALLPGELELAGLPIPRSFEVVKEYDNEWVLQSKSASALKTANYVSERLFTGSITRTSAGGFRFESAQIKHNRSLPRVAVRVSPIKGHDNASELSIRRIPVQPAVERPPADVAEAKLREARKFAQ